MGQGTLLWDNYKNPSVSKYKTVKNLEKEFRSAAGYKVSSQFATTRRSPYYNKLRDAIYFGTEEDISREYWKTYNFVSNELLSDNFKDVVYINKKARQTIMQVIKAMNPVKLSTEGKYREQSKKSEFYGWLSKRNRELALWVERDFNVRLRRINKIIRTAGPKNTLSIFPSIKD